MPSSHHGWRIAALLLIVGLAPLLTVPTAACGFNDDWSYAKMAFDVTRTGTFHYDGWATAAVGPQAYWGALFVRAFGESHMVLRCSTMVLAAMSAALIYGIGLLCELSPSSAFQAALAVMLCPVVFPLSTSFTTDLPALCVGLFGLCFGLLFLRSDQSLRKTLLLLAMIVAGLIGGNIRQPVWLINVLVAPALLHIDRSPRRLRLAWASLVLIGIAAMFMSLHRLQAQPLLISDHLGSSLLQALREPLATGRRTVHLFTTTVLLLTPIGLTFWPLLRSVRRPIVGFIIALTLAEIVPLGLFRNIAYLTPWVGNLITDWGILPEQTDMLGDKPRVFPIAVSAVLLAWGLAWFNVAILTLCLRAPRWIRLLARRLRRPQPIDLIVLYAAASVALSVLRPLIVFDRYILPALPAAIIVLAKLQERYVAAQPTFLSWLMLAAWAGFGWAIAFDYHACLRGRMTAVSALHAAGIASNRISAGLEPDGETQLREAGHMNDPRIATPGVYRDLIVNPRWPAAVYWLWPETPAIEPRYVLSRQPLNGYHESAIRPIHYWSCFPPFERTIYTLELDEAVHAAHMVRRAD